MCVCVCVCVCVHMLSTCLFLCRDSVGYVGMVCFCFSGWQIMQFRCLFKDKVDLCLHQNVFVLTIMKLHAYI